MKPKENSPDNCEKVLTSIHGKYTLPNTEEYCSKVDELTVKNFLNNLAEVALSVAHRKQRIRDD